MVSHLMVPWQPTTRGGAPGPSAAENGDSDVR
jgi:hypothetical protein